MKVNGHADNAGIWYIVIVHLAEQKQSLPIRRQRKKRCGCITGFLEPCFILCIRKRAEDIAVGMDGSIRINRDGCNVRVEGTDR